MFKTIKNIKIVKKITKLFVKERPKPLLLSDFKETKTIEDDPWGPIYENHKLEYFNDQGESIGYNAYSPKMGQIGIFVLEEEYRNRGLGKQILLKCMDEMRSHDVKEMFLVSTPDHPVWLNIFNNALTSRDPAQLDPNIRVTGGGFYLKL
jgi:GNAT superfamily N-acetyltransferase